MTTNFPVRKLRMIKEFRGKYRWLSNFVECEVEIDGEKYRTVEHGYQSMKMLDLEKRRQIQSCSTPGRSKRMGQRVMLREDWEDIKVIVMLDLLQQKFSQEKFRNLLLSTGNKEIVEGNYWHDNFWGVCYCEECIESEDGQNVLGKLIMLVRSTL